MDNNEYLCLSKVPTDEEDLDPRVQVELEKLNNATDEINRLETTLEEVNNSFRASLNDTSNQLLILGKRLGNCIEKARPYYEATEKARKLQLDCQRAAIQYQRANAVHQAARETIALAEERFANFKDQSERKFDSAWQEMLNHATIKIMEAEAQKSASEKDHMRRAASYTTAERDVQEMYKSLKSAIQKSRPYFNYRISTQIQLEAKKEKIHKLQKEISHAKQKYSLSLHNLEQISEEIHENRRINMKREPGVGAEMEQNEAYVECFQPPKETKYWKEMNQKLNELKDEELNAGNDISTKSLRNRDSVFSTIDNLSIAYDDINCGASATSSFKSQRSSATSSFKSQQLPSKSYNSIATNYNDTSSRLPPTIDNDSQDFNQELNNRQRDNTSPTIPTLGKIYKAQPAGKESEDEMTVTTPVSVKILENNDRIDNGILNDNKTNQLEDLKITTSEKSTIGAPEVLEERCAFLEGEE